MLIKKKSLLVSLVSGSIICGVLVLTLVGYLVYLEIKDKELEATYRQLLQKINTRLYSRHIEVSDLTSAIEPSGALKGKPIVKGVMKNKGYRTISDVLLMVKFLDNDGVVLYEVVFHPQEPSLGSSSLAQVNLPYLSGPPKTAIAPGQELPFKKILTHCPREITDELGKDGRAPGPRGGWSGKMSAEAVSISF